MALYNAFPAGSDLTDALLNAAVPIGARYEQRSLQTVTNAADNKMKFETAVHTNTDVIASGTNNTDFALQRIGLWRVSVGARFLGTAGAGERHIFPQTGSVFAAANRLVGDTKVNVGSAPVTLSCATDFKIAAVTTIIVGLFQNSGGSINTDPAFGGTAHIALTWLGPA